MFAYKQAIDLNDENKISEALKIYKAHAELQKSERVAVEAEQEKARKFPQQLSNFHLDETSSFFLPFASPAVQALRQVKLEIGAGGLLDFSRSEEHLFFKLGALWPKDANLILTQLFFALIALLSSESAACSAPELRLQTDNCAGENRNLWVLAFLAILVRFDIFKIVRLATLLVGHTFGPIDGAGFRPMHASRGHQALSLTELVASLNTLRDRGVQVQTRKWTGPNLVFVQRCLNWKSFLAPIVHQLKGHSQYHSFTFTKENGVVQMWASVYASACESKEVGPIMFADLDKLDSSNWPDWMEPDTSLFSTEIHNGLQACFDSGLLDSAQVDEFRSILSTGLFPINKLEDCLEKGKVGVKSHLSLLPSIEVSTIDRGIIPPDWTWTTFSKDFSSKSTPPVSLHLPTSGIHIARKTKQEEEVCRAAKLEASGGTASVSSSSSLLSTTQQNATKVYSSAVPPKHSFVILRKRRGETKKWQLAMVEGKTEEGEDEGDIQVRFWSCPTNTRDELTAVYKPAVCKTRRGGYVEDIYGGLEDAEQGIVASRSIISSDEIIVCYQSSSSSSHVIPSDIQVVIKNYLKPSRKRRRG
jgi:hypothetical protein